MAYLPQAAAAGDRYFVGRHSVAEDPPPPADKPRYRFAVAIAGILGLAFITMALVNVIFPEQGPTAAGQDRTGLDSNPFPATPGGLPGDPDPEQRRSMPSADGPLTGSFRITEDWGLGFTAVVELANAGTAPEPWQVVLALPDEVGELLNRWIALGPGSAEVTRSGQTVVFSGSQNLDAGTSIELFFQFSKEGGDVTAVQCWVNGRACT